MRSRNELIITFHGLGEPPPSIPADERRVWVPAEWLDAVAGAAPPKGLSFAFDDGNASDVEQALPILQAHGLSARFFVLTGRLGQPGYLSAEDVTRLHQAGMRIGSHGLNHRDWRRIDSGELRNETHDSRRILERAHRSPVAEAACPFGSYDRRVLRALRAAGYERVFTSDGGPAASGSTVMPRTSIGPARALDDWLALARGAGGEGPSLTLRAKRMLKRLR